MRYQELFPVPTAGLDEADSLLVDSVHRWADSRVMAKRQKLGEGFAELLTPALAALLGEVGLRQLVWAADDSGAPAPRGATLALALEQVGRADLGLAFVLANNFALQRALGSGAPAPIRARALADVADPWPGLGALVLPGYGEASAAFHGLAAPARARRRGDALLLESGGPVRAQAAGADAGWLGLACELEGQPALALVPGDAAGLRRGAEPLKTTGLAASRQVELTFSAVSVPADHLALVGHEPYQALLAWYRLCCAAACSGALLAARAILADWSEVRVIKGKGQVFRDNPLVASQLGRIGARIGTSRLLVLGLAALLDEAPGAPATTATAGAVLTTVLAQAMEALDWTMELMASAGYAAEWQLERPWRDVKTLQTLLGPAPAAATELARHYFGSDEPASPGRPAPGGEVGR